MMRSNYNDRARLVLGEPNAVYYAGQELTGYIKLEIFNPIQFSAINITFHGEARTHWTEEEIEEYNGVRRTRQVQYNGHQECLHYVQSLYGKAQPGCDEGLIDLKSLPLGERELPFKFILPYDIPSSFKSERGRITYSATAYVEYLDNSMGRDELYHEFQVVAPMNLLEDDIVRPLEMHMEEVYSCWCSSRPMSIDVQCPASGYCPGQAIPINIKIKNDSAIEVKKIVFELVKKELYRSQVPQSEFTTPEEVLSTTKTGAVLSNTSKGLTCHLPVPAMIAPNMDNCDIIDIGFFLKATVKLTGCNDDLEEQVLLFIGLKPIPGTPGSENYVHPLASSLPNGAPVSDPPLRAYIEQIALPNPNSYPGGRTSPYPGGRTSPYPADTMNSRPIQPLNSYPGQNAPPYPTYNASNSGLYPPPKPMGDIPSPYPSSTPPNPLQGSTSPYPIHNPPPPKPMGDIPPPYPSPTPPNPLQGSISPYPIHNPPPPKPMGDIPPPYPSPTPPNPLQGSISPYPIHNPPPPKPMGDIPPPYPSPAPPNPLQDSTSPYPIHNPPYSPYLATNSPYPPSGSESMSMTTLRTQNVGFVLPTGSPYPPGKTDVKNSPYTPLMQNYSPSAPPLST